MTDHRGPVVAMRAAHESLHGHVPLIPMITQLISILKDVSLTLTIRASQGAIIILELRM